MNEHTTKVEGISFTAKDAGASAAAEKLGHSFERLNHIAEHTRHKVAEYAHHAAAGTVASLGLGFGIHEVYEKAKEANLVMDKVERSLTGTLYAMQGWRKGTSEIDKMAYSMKQAEEETERLEEMELKLRTPIEELGATYREVATTGFAKLGMSQHEVLDLTEKITAAAKVYGTTGPEAMMKVNRVLITGRVGMRDVSGLAEKLRESLHLKKGEKLGPEELMHRISKGLGDMVPVSQKMGENFSGNLFEASALVEKMIEDLSRPLFKEQTKNLSEWVTKLRAVREDGKSIMEIYGEKLAGAFRTMKDITAFISEHWKSIAAIFVTSKLGSMMGGFAASHAGGATAAEGAAGHVLGKMGAMNVTANIVNVNSATAAAQIGSEVGTVLRPTMSSTIGKLAGLASKAFVVTSALGLLYEGLQGISAYVDAKHEEELQKKRTAANLVTATANFTHSVKSMYTGVGAEAREAAQKSMRSAFEAMGVKEGGKFSQESVMGALEGLGPELAAQTVNKLSVIMPQMIHHVTAGVMEMSPAESAREIVTAMNLYAAKLFEGSSETGPTQKRKVPGAPQINIGNLTITQEFREADPDRVFHKVTNEIQDMVAAPGRGAAGMNLSGGMS